jgi:hypothetical protein
MGPSNMPVPVAPGATVTEVSVSVTPVVDILKDETKDLLCLVMVLVCVAEEGKKQLALPGSKKLCALVSLSNLHNHTLTCSPQVRSRRLVRADSWLNWALWLPLVDDVQLLSTASAFVAANPPQSVSKLGEDLLRAEKHISAQA